MSYVLFFSDLTSLTGFLVTFRSINVFDWSKRNVLIRQFMVSKRNKLKLACDLKSPSAGFISCCCDCPISGSIILGAQIVHSNEDEGIHTLFIMHATQKVN